MRSLTFYFSTYLNNTFTLSKALGIKSEVSKVSELIFWGDIGKQHHIIWMNFFHDPQKSAETLPAILHSSTLPQIYLFIQTCQISSKTSPKLRGLFKSEMKPRDFGSEGKVHLGTFHYDFFESSKMPWVFKYILFSSSPVRGGKMYSFGKVLEVMLRELVPPMHIWGPLPAQQSVAWTAGNYGEIGVKDKPGL